MAIHDSRFTIYGDKINVIVHESRILKELARKFGDQEMQRKKALFLPAGIGLAHVGRTCVLAGELKRRGFAVCFGIGKHSSLIVKRENFPFEIIPEVSWEVYERKFRKLNPNIYSKRMIERFVESELELYRKERPDVVVADARPTAKISAKIAGIPLVALANIDATPFYDFTKVAVRFPAYWSRLMPKKMLKLLEKETGSVLLKKIAPYFLKAMTIDQLLKFNLVLLKYTKDVDTNILNFFLGDVTLLLDIPQYRPVKPLPENVRLIGPIFWEGSARPPSWANKLRPDRKTVYVTAGGTGDRRIFQKIIDYLSATPYQVVATVGNVCDVDRIRFPQRNDFFISRFVPGGWIMRMADVVIFPGGSATSYQALSYGVPQIGIPVNIDQEDSVNQLVRMGTGISIDPYSRLDRDRLLAATEKILHDRSYKKKAMKLKEILARYDGVKTAAGVVEELLLTRTRPPRAPARRRNSAAAAAVWAP